MSVRFVWRGDQVNRQIRARAQRALQEVGNQALAFCQDLTPVDTGRLRAGWEGITDTQRIRFILRNNVPYCVYVEYGARGRPGVAMGRRTLDQFGPVLMDVVRQARGGLA